MKLESEPENGKTPPVNTPVVCYARVSRIDMNPENQYEDLKRRAEQFGNYELLSEKESTRKTRPVKENILAGCRRGIVKTVIVWKLDRWARSSAELVLNMSELKKCGVRFISIRDGIDLDPLLSNPVQDLYYNMLAAFAQFERDLIRERTLAGLARARQLGKTLGRPRKYPKIG